jgi:Transposase DDE domain group 1
VIDLDAHVLVCHSEKEQTAATFTHTFGYHPLLAFCDNTGEFLAAQLRPGNAGNNTAADHITFLEQALTQIPDAYRHGHPVLIRADGAGCTKAFLAHIRARRQHGVACEFSVGWTITAREHATIATLSVTDRTPAIDTAGEPRPLDQAAVAEITGLLPPATLATYPLGTRVIVRRERPHAGAQLEAIEEPDGYRYTAHATDTRTGLHAFRDARHRAHARVEDHIRTGRDTGLGRLPSRSFVFNQAWLATTMIAVDLLAFAQTILLHDTALARAERRRSATDCCTSQRASPADNAGSGYDSTNTGPGPATLPPHSPDRPPCPRPQADTSPRILRHPERPAAPAGRRHRHAQPRQHRPVRSTTDQKIDYACP